MAVIEHQPLGAEAGTLYTGQLRRFDTLYTCLLISRLIVGRLTRHQVQMKENNF
jgi:hypothetical protein